MQRVVWLTRYLGEDVAPSHSWGPTGSKDAPSPKMPENYMHTKGAGRRHGGPCGQGIGHMAGPAQATVKRLFSVSGNRCAFPKCGVPNVDVASGKVTGRICHIRASQPGGPRYDASQADAQRHGFANLILLCPIHHDVIDADVESYSVERLERMKTTHESTQPPVQPPSDSAVAQALAISKNNISHGSIIVSNNQLGGQIAHSIQNFGPQPRRCNQAAADALASALRKHPPETSVELYRGAGDSEAEHATQIIGNYVEKGGWGDPHMGTILAALPPGIRVDTDVLRPGIQAFLDWLRAVGWKAELRVGCPGTDFVRIAVGGNL